MTMKDVLKFIRFNLLSGFSETLFVRKECYFLMLKILCKYGFEDDLYKEPLKLADEFLTFKKIEEDIYFYILKNLRTITDFDEVHYSLEDIDDLHEKAFFRLDKDWGDIEVGLEMDKRNKIKKSKYSDLFHDLLKCEEDIHNLNGYCYEKK